MSLTKRQAAAGIRRFNVNLPVATLDWFHQRATQEGVSIQSLIAPVLNAVARGEIQQSGYTVSPAGHGNAKQRQAA